MAYPWCNVPLRLNAKRKVSAAAAFVEGCDSYTQRQCHLPADWCAIPEEWRRSEMAAAACG
jgi:hypothetical protein